MKIAVWHNLHSGGGKRSLYQHVRGLLALGHEVEVWAPDTIDKNYLPLSELTREHLVPLHVPTRRTFRQMALPGAFAKAQVAAMDDHCRRCLMEIEAGGFDVLFANTCYQFATTAIGRLSRLPSVMYLQEPRRFLYEALPDLIWSAPPERPAPSPAARWRTRVCIDDARVLVREETRNAKGYGRILANSYFSRESILRAYGVPSSVCYLGIDTDAFVRADAAREDFLIGLGSFNIWKNPGLAVEALALVAEPRPRLIWVANGEDVDYRREVEAMALAHGVTLDVRVGIPDTELQRLLSTARAMIYTSRLEPFGLAPVEANACGTPVVGVAEGGVRESMVDGVNGLLTDGTPSSLAAAVERLCCDSILAQRLGEAGRTRAEQLFSTHVSTACVARNLQEQAAVGR